MIIAQENKYLTREINQNITNIYRHAWCGEFGAIVQWLPAHNSALIIFLDFLNHKHNIFQIYQSVRQQEELRDVA